MFDIDGTLLDFSRAEHDAMQDTLASFGFASDEQIIARYSVINDEHWKMLERGEIDRPTLIWRRFEVLGEQCGLAPLDPHAFAEAYIELLSHKSYLMEDAVEVCRALAPHYRMCAATNGNSKVQHGRFDPSPLAPLFYHCFISEEMGCNKPSIAYFDCVRRKLPDLDPSRTLVIGDSLSSDIAGGIRWATDTCWVCRDAKQASKAKEQGLVPTYQISRLKQLLDILL